MQDALALAFGTAAAGAVVLLILSPLFPSLRPLWGGARNPNLALWAGLATAMACAMAVTVPQP
jgi:hypothetical protein